MSRSVRVGAGAALDERWRSGPGPGARRWDTGCRSQQRRAARRSQRPHDLAVANLGLLAVDVKAGDGTRRGELFDEVLRWSAMFGDTNMPKNAALWMVEGRSDEPLVALPYLRRTLVAGRDSGQWSTIDVTLRRLVPVLMDLGLLALAATVLGAIDVVDSTYYDDHPGFEETAARLQDQLGSQLDRHRRAGRAIPRAELVALVLAETDLAVGRRPDRVGR